MSNFYVLCSKQVPKYGDWGAVLFFIFTGINSILVFMDLCDDGWIVLQTLLRNTRKIISNNPEHTNNKYYDSVTNDGDNTALQSVVYGLVDLIPLVLMHVVCFSPANIHLVSWILLIWLASRELFQMIADFKNYITHRENYIELGIIGLSAFLLSYSKPEDQIARNFAAFAVILTWFELTRLLVKHPKFSRLNTLIERS